MQLTILIRNKSRKVLTIQYLETPDCKLGLDVEYLRSMCPSWWRENEEQIPIQIHIFFHLLAPLGTHFTNSPTKQPRGMGGQMSLSVWRDEHRISHNKVQINNFQTLI